MLGRLINEALRERPSATPWGGTMALFRKADWNFCNLECVISDLVPSRLPDEAFHSRSDRKDVAEVTHG